jgi:hypothetical protein
VHPGDGLIGPMSLDGKDAGVVFRYQTGKVVQHELLEKHFVEKRDAKLPSRGVAVVLKGRLQLSAKMTVLVRVAGGSCSHGVHTLYVDGRELGSVGDDLQKSRSYWLELAPGEHLVRWELTGGLFGNSVLRFEEADTGKLLPLSYTKDDLKGIESFPAKRVVDVTAEERGWPIPQGW